MEKDLNEIELKMKALGFLEPQIQSIITETLGGRLWGELDSEEKYSILQSLEERINFVRKFLKHLNCKNCGN